MRELTMPLSVWMIEQLHLQPGQRVLDLAAGPGETGFLAAELIAPTGTLITSDAVEAMLDVARARAAELGVSNVEFRELQLEWIDLPTASVDAVLCRWGVMLIVDPEAALREIRRVLRPGGRVALAVWDEPGVNPWTTITSRALIELGHASPPEPGTPGMFALADRERLRELLETAGFDEIVIDAIDLPRTYPTVEALISETRDCSQLFAEVAARLSEEELDEVARVVASNVAPYADAGGDGGFTLPGRTLVAAASA
jgi:ubiquinone/menaquinone biosynthesis C-methylase UbiE